MVTKTQTEVRTRFTDTLSITFKCTPSKPFLPICGCVIVQTTDTPVVGYRVAGYRVTSDLGQIFPGTKSNDCRSNRVGAGKYSVGYSVVLDLR